MPNTPGLQVATSFDAVVGSPDVASDGTARLGWGPDLSPSNSSHVEGISDMSFALYFFVQQQANVKPAVFTSAALTSTKHPAKGAGDLECSPQVTWSQCSNFQPPKSGCSENEWTEISGITKDGVPPQPLGVLKAPIRAKFDYSVCKGSGAVRLNYDLLFGEFDRLSLNWYKYSGNAPGFDIFCSNGCSSLIVTLSPVEWRRALDNIQGPTVQLLQAHGH